MRVYGGGVEERKDGKEEEEGEGRVLQEEGKGDEEGEKEGGIGTLKNRQAQAQAQVQAYMHTGTYLGKRASTGSFCTWARVNKSSRAGTPFADPLAADAGRVLSGERERERSRLSRERFWKCAIGSAASLCA